MNDKILTSINDTLGRIERLLTKDAQPKIGLSTGFSLGKSSFSKTTTNDVSSQVKTSNIHLSTISLQLKTIIDKMDGKTVQSKANPSANLVNLIPEITKARTQKDLKRGLITSRTFTRISKQLSQGIAEFADTKDKKISVGISNMILFGETFGKVARQVTLGSLMLLPALPLMPIAAFGIIGLSKAFSYVGDTKRAKRIRQGSIAVGLIGKSLIGFSLGIGIFALTFGAITTGGFGLLGSGGDLTLGGVVKSIGVVGLGIATIWGLSFLYQRIGSPKAASSIIKGSIVVSLMGLSLAAVTFGLSRISNVEFIKENNWETAGLIGATIVGTGLVFAGAGALAGPIALGSVAMGLAGLSLAALSFGVDSMLKITQKYGDAAEVGESFKILMANVGLGILAFVDPSVLKSANESKSTLGKITSAVGSLVTGAVNTATMLASAAAITTAGLSLRSLSKGIQAFQKTGILDKSQAEIEEMSVGTRDFFYNFGEAFAIPKDKRRDMMKGAFALTTSSKALSSLSSGLSEWYSNRIPDSEFSMRDGFGIDEDKMVPQTMLESITMTLGAIRIPFAQIGRERVETGGVFGKIFGSRNAVALGIRAVKNVGKRLEEISTGLKSFKGLKPEDVKTNVIYDKETGSFVFPDGKMSLMDNILVTTTLISNVFAQLGEAEQGSRQSVLGFKVGKGNTERGAKAAAKAAEMLGSIGGSITAFSKDVDYVSAANRATEFVSAFVGGLSEIGDFGDRKKSRRIRKVLDSSNDYLGNTSRIVESIVKIDGKSGSIATFNQMFTDIGKLPHDKITAMFEEMRKTIIEMKSMNKDLLQKQLDIYKAQADVASKEITKMQTGTTKTVAGKEVVIQNNQDNISALAALLDEIRNSIEELNDTMLSGTAKVKVNNFEELNI